MLEKKVENYENLEIVGFLKAWFIKLTFILAYFSVLEIQIVF